MAKSTEFTEQQIQAVKKMAAAKNGTNRAAVQTRFKLSYGKAKQLLEAAKLKKKEASKIEGNRLGKASRTMVYTA